MMRPNDPFIFKGCSHITVLLVALWNGGCYTISLFYEITLLIQITFLEHFSEHAQINYQIYTAIKYGRKYIIVIFKCWEQI